MIREEINRLRTASDHALRKFAYTVGAMLIGFGLLSWRRHHLWSCWLLMAGATVALLGMVCPRTLKWCHVAWMTMALLLGTMVSSALLTLSFFLLVTPLGFVSRIAGRDFLNRRIRPDQSSYWTMRDVSKRKRREQYEQQF